MKIIRCPRCQVGLKVSLEKLKAGFQCPKCSASIAVRRKSVSTEEVPVPAVPLNDAEQWKDDEDYSENEYSGIDDDDHAVTDSDEYNDEYSDDAEAADDWVSWDGLSEEIDACEAAEDVMEEVNERAGPTMGYIPTPLMERDDYRKKDALSSSKGLGTAYSLFTLMFNNLLVGFSVLILAVVLIIGLPLIILFRQWNEDSGAADGNEVRIMQTAGNLVDTTAPFVDGTNAKDSAENIKARNQAVADQRAARIDGRTIVRKKAAAAVPQRYRENATKQKMSQVFEAIIDYQLTFRSLPHPLLDRDGQKAKLSWRVRILPLLNLPEAQQLYDEFRHDEAWDSPHNLRLLPRMPDVFRVPGSTAESSCLHVYAGPGAAFEVAVLTSLHDLKEAADTILLVTGGPETAVEWTKPDGLMFRPSDPFRALGTRSTDGLPVVMVDGSTYLLSKELDPEVYVGLVRRDDGKTLPELTRDNDGEIVMGESVGGVYYPGW